MRLQKFRRISIIDCTTCPLLRLWLRLRLAALALLLFALLLLLLLLRLVNRGAIL